MKRFFTAGLALCALAVALSSARAEPLPKPGLCDFGSCSAQQRAPSTASTLAAMLARARLATAKYATDLARGKADGYRIITRMIPDMGYHFLNPKISRFDVTRPAILVYLKRGHAWQLGALEWVFPSKPKVPPLPGARYGGFSAACHYADGTFVPEPSRDDCPGTSPQSGAAFGFWHPDLVTLHVWLWYPNPSGIYSGTNPLATPYNRG